ncbi:MAG: stage II sporulation protein M [Candidatus Bathyarchaeota archaeon]
MALNWLFFGAMVVGAVLDQVGVVWFFEWPVGQEVLTLRVDLAWIMVVDIFLFNLVLSSFLLVTLTGLLFFGLPLAFLLYRALLWGALINMLPTSLLFAALLTLILEGEGYVLASLAGFNLGLSWLKPKWVYEGEGLSRLESVKKALRDSLRVYVLVAVLLLCAAVVETLTIILIF